jgi:hypothetical protein
VPIEIPPFAVAPEAVAGLGDSFTPLINQLLDTESAAAGMSGVDLATTYRVNLADGGVDAGLRRSAGNRWLPSGDSAWQFKAGDLKPQQCADELAGATAALEVLRNGGKYRLVLGAGLNDTKIKARRQRLIEKAEELGLTLQPDSIEVLDANALARWIQEHPYLAVSPLLGGMDTVALNFDSWAESNRHQSLWVSSDSRVELGEEVRRFAAGHSQLDLRIEGVSGLGKTRGVLEAFRGSTYQSLVVYVRAADELSPQLIPRLLNQDRTGIIVIDDCGRRQHERLASLLPASSALRLITIGEADDFDVQVAGVRLQRLDEETLDKILIENEPSLPPEHRRVVVAHVDGNVRWALRLAEGILRQQAGSATELLTPEVIRTYVTDALSGDGDFLASSALAVFTRIGYEGDLAVELDWLADLLGFRPTELRAAARGLSQAGLLDKQGRYRSVAPHPLAVYLAGVAWQEFGDVLIRALPDMPPALAERLLRRAADVGRSEATSSVVERILAPGGPFSTLSELESGSNSRLLTQAAIISPEQVTRHLVDLFASSSDEALEQATSIRRDLVWTLEKLVWHSRSFEAAADCLLRLALAENESFANNATGTWVELFGTQLPGTAASPVQRMAYLRTVATDGRPQVRILALRACAQALSHHEFITVSGELQGSMLVEPRGRPRTWGELWDYQRDAITLARARVDDNEQEVSGAALKVLIDALHPFLEVEPIRDTLFEALATLPVHALERVWTEINHLRGLFERVSGVEDRKAGLDVLVSRLPAQTPRDELRALAHVNRWDLEDGELLTKMAATVAALAPEEAIAELLTLLDEPELPAAYEVGQTLHALRPEPDTLSAIVAKVSHGATLTSLTGYLQSSTADHPDAFDRFLESSDSESLPDETVLALTVRGPQSALGWSRVVRLIERLPVHVAVPRLFGWHVGLGEARLSELLRLWTSRFETQADYNACIDFVAMAVHRTPDPLPEADPLIAELVARLREYPKTGQKSWDWAQLAKRQLHDSPAALLTLCLDLIEQGSLMMHGSSEEETVLREAIRRVGDESLGLVLARVDAGSWRVQMDLRGWVLREFPADTVTAWIAGDLDRARVVASLAGVPESGSPDGVVRFLLDQFGEDDNVASSLMGDYISGMWTGNESDRLAAQVEQMSTWIESAEGPGVKKWAERVRTSLRARRKRVLVEEAEEGR